MALLVLPLVGCTSLAPSPTASSTPASTPITSPTPPASEALADDAFRQLETSFDARLGVYALDTGSGRIVSFRADERFAYDSSYKALLVAAVLSQTSDADLDRVVEYTSDDLVAHSPITEQHMDARMTLAELNDAAIRYSDNTAANLLLDRIGGPAGLSSALALIGDGVTHVDRTEPELNDATPGDVRDTSTPRALGADLQRYVLGDGLTAEKQTILVGLLQGNTTGDTLIRAGVPDGWIVGDKTGSGGYGTRNDIAVVWPPGRAPLVLAILSSRAAADADYDDALIAQATQTVVTAMLRAG